MNKNVIFKIIILILITGASACTKPEMGKIEKSVLFAKTSLEDVNHNQAARLSFGEIMELGGTPVTYITANTESLSGFAPFIDNGPAKPWSVVIRKGDDTGNFIIIEGYNGDLKKPVIVEKVNISWKLTPSN